MKSLIAIAAAMLGALSAIPAAAQNIPAEQLTGVWRGRIGTLPLHACFDPQAEPLGVYYYDRHLKPIRLEGDGPLLRERVGWSQEISGTWVLERLEGSTLAGHWRDGERELPIVLDRIGWERRADYAGVCESSAFVMPRLRGGRIAETGAALAGQRYTVLDYVAPPHLISESLGPLITITSLRIEEQAPGDAAINRRLSAMLAVENPDSEAADCIAFAMGAMGTDGDFSQFAQPEVLTQRWLGVLVSTSMYCGGAHPSTSQHFRVFDRQSGEEIAAETWLNDSGIPHEEDRLDQLPVTIAMLTQELRGVIVAHWPEGGAGEAEFDRDCEEAALAESFWSIGLAPEGVGGGMAFIPSMPQVIAPCAQSVVVGWDELAPFLSKEGRSVAETFGG